MFVASFYPLPPKLCIIDVLNMVNKYIITKNRTIETQLLGVKGGEITNQGSFSAGVERSGTLAITDVVDGIAQG